MVVVVVLAVLAMMKTGHGPMFTTRVAALEVTVINYEKS